MQVTRAPGGGLIKEWSEGVVIEDKAREQIERTAAMPFVFKHLAVMPDAHWGMGSTVGTVLPTKGAIIPAAVGVDIGCGMMAVQLGLRAHSLPDNLAGVRTAIEAAVPHGRTNNGGPGDRGAWGEVPNDVHAKFTLGDFYDEWDVIADEEPKFRGANHVSHLGTLGTGNHFIEVCLDEKDWVWIMLHSGSRGIGNLIGRTYIAKAKRDMERFFIHLPDKDLAYLAEGSTVFDDYILAMRWAQKYATINREIIMERTIRAVSEALFGRPNALPVHRETEVNCHHNFAALEHHYGANVWVTRKGAVRARVGDLGIIPGSMGDRSFIVRGLGNRESFHSCSHGAGRAMSRTAARKRFTVEEHAAATNGVECRKDESVLDETPDAYKDIGDVMAAQSELVEVVHTLKQVVCVKG